MNKSIIALCGGIMFLASCTEKAPLINFGGSTSTDTTYLITTVPTAQQHNVLIEEFTGESCSNCPAAHAQLVGLEGSNPGRLNVIGLYEFGPTQTIPPGGASYDFRDSTATGIANNVYNGVNQLPSAGIDRVSYAGSMRIDKSNWGTLIGSQLTVSDSVNVDVQSTYASGTATINVTVTYLYPVSSAQNISVVVVEDSIIDFQEYPEFDASFPSGMDSSYVFTNVFRGMVSTAPFGDPINTPSATKEAGRVYRRTYTYTPAVKTPAIVPAHCRVIAFVNSATGSDYHVWQSAQTKLVP